MKNLKKAIVLLISLSLLLFLFACGPTECKEHKDEDTDGKCDVCGEDVTPEEGGDENGDGLSLIEGGEAKFTLVVSSTASGSTNLTVDKLVKTFKDLGVEVTKTTDASPEGEIEILIGDVKGRGAEYDIDEHTLGLKGYLVELIGKKIVVCAGSEDALADAIDVLKEDFFGIKKATESLDSVTVNEDMNVKEIQDNYRITGISVEGKEINTFKIKVDTSNADMMNSAKVLQNTIYAAKGYWLEIVDASDAADGSFIELLITKDVGIEGYEVSVKDGDLLIKTEFPNKAAEATEGFLSKNISTVVGKAVNFDKKFSYTSTVRYVYYSEFKTYKNDGITVDDFATIKKCHEYANKYGHTVKADTNSNFYIGDTGGAFINVKTNVEWGNAVFNIDDKAYPSSAQSRTSHIFVMQSSFDDWRKIYNEGDPMLDGLKDGFLGSELTNIGFAPGYKALIYLYDANNYAYNRHGTHATETPPAQREFVIVDEEGNLTDNTSFLLDFTGVTSMHIYRVDDEPITISGGTFITDANNALPIYTAYSRGLLFNRSNVTIKNTVHKIINEPAQDSNPDVGYLQGGAPYSGFISYQYCNNLRCENLTLQSHKAYKDYDYDENGKPIGIHSTMGSYDIGGSNANNITFYNCTQSNFYKPDGTTPYDQSEYWGIQGTNYCKNMTYDKCLFSRLDAHAGVQNVVIRDTTIVYINLIGGGEALIEGCTIIAPTVNSTGVVALRSDYGSTWRGDIIIKDCNFYSGANASQTYLINAIWNDWDFGNYKTHLPNVTVDNLNIVNAKSTVYIYSDVETSGAKIDQEYFPGGIKNKNPMFISPTVTIKNNNSGHVYDGTRNDYINSKVTIREE